MVNRNHNLLKVAYKNNVKKPILTSLSAVYGNIDVPLRDDMVTDAYPNIYAVTKYTN